MDFVHPKYDVFLNFQGLDTRGTIIDFLYESMTLAGIRVFVGGDCELLFPEESREEANRAIGNSRIFMPVFSTNYASSVRCLEELTMMVDLCGNAAADKLILPIFYDVEPYEVRHPAGLYWKALDEHKGEYGNKTVQKWAEALREVSRMPGWILEIFGIRILIRQVVQDVLHRLKFRKGILPVHLIGMDDRVDEVVKLLSCGSPGTRCVVVHGVGGVGKTTLANILFNKLFTRFDKCSFISEVQDFSLGNRGKTELQKKLLDDIFGPWQTSMMTNQKSLTGVRDQTDTMKAKSVLIILDDLHDKKKLNWFLGNCKWLGPAARIIITTSDRSIGDGLMIPPVVSAYEMKELTDDHAVQLLSRHAFGKDKPPDEYVTTLKRIACAVGNLPLALEVIGGHLHGETREVWEDTLMTLGKGPNGGIREAFSISYQALNDREKEFFLDLACLSNEVPKKHASIMLDSYNWIAKSIVIALASKSLIRILPGYEFWMHDLLRELGRQIVFDQGYTRDDGKRTRSWIIPEDASAPKRSTGSSSAIGAPEIYGLMHWHRLSFKEFRGMTPWRHIQNQDTMIDKGPSTSHSAQADDPNNDLSWEKVEMKEGNEGSSLVATGKIQLAAEEPLFIGKGRVEAVVELMNADSYTVGITGICGSDGYGKTTLAKAVCSEISSQFDAFCFLEDIKETMLLPQGIRSLQNKLTRDTWKGESAEGAPPPSTMRFDESELPHTKVLIVLDDIEDFSHVKELVGDKLSSRFGRGSRIIVTIGGNHVDVENLGADWVTIYHVSEMDMEPALQLFSQQAFGQDSPLPHHHGIANTIVKGLKMCPLLIEIIGSMLRGKSFGEFQKMSRLIEPLAHGLRDIIRMSYDSLDDLQKQIFLDIACFVSCEDVRTAAHMWHDFMHKYPDQIVVPHAKAGRDNRLRMHGLVRQLGREIVRAEGSVGPSGMCNRVFANGKAVDVVTNRKVKAHVEALCLKYGDQPSDELNSQDKEASVKLTAENFRNITRLRFLDLDSSAIVNEFGDVFSTLRWLRWQKCPKEFEATNVKMESLVILDLSGSAVTENWGGWKTIHMTNLKVLNLSHCTGLRVAPPLNGFPKLERLILERCSQLTHIDSSIGVLKHLVFLNLKFCRELTKFPKELGKLKALRELLIDGTKVEEIQEINKLGKLEVLSSADCILLGCIPDSIGALKNLRDLTLRGCRRIKNLPDNMEGLRSSMIELDISGTGVLELPASIASLGSLKVLRMESCYITKLTSFIGSLLNLEEIHASCCRNLKDISTEIGKLRQLRILELRCTSISGLPESIKNLDKLEVLDLLNCDDIEKLPKLPAHLNLLKVNPELQQEIQFA